MVKIGVLPEHASLNDKGSLFVDVAYAACASLGIALIWNHMPASIASAIAFAVCIAIECFQLTGIPLQLNRSDFLPIRVFAYLVLGSGFSWWDMLAYAVGVVVAAVGDVCLTRHTIDSISDRGRSRL